MRPSLCGKGLFIGKGCFEVNRELKLSCARTGLEAVIQFKSGSVVKDVVQELQVDNEEEDDDDEEERRLMQKLQRIREKKWRGGGGGGGGRNSRAKARMEPEQNQLGLDRRRMA